jgi:primosomal protein N' (replication factor Y) (superfamily II helicase)
MGPIAKVIVDIATGREFDYRVPERLRDVVHVGSRVHVPFGHRNVQGHVVAFAEKSSYPGVKEIAGVIGERPLLDPTMIELARWMARYYCCPVETAMRCVLPEAVRRGETTFKQNLHVRLTAAAAAGPLALGPRAAKQSLVVEILKANPHGLFLAELLRKAGVTAAVVETLKHKGIVEISAKTAERDPYSDEVFLPSEPLPLNAAQQQALDLVCRSADTLEPAVVLIHGVTGSGKTEVYLQAIDHVLAQSKGVIVLVPEIALTPQTVERFKSRFNPKRHGTQVAVLHSHLSSGERHDEWHKIHRGDARIVIGARSAVFAPVNSPGLIVVDEEHETSYKQEEAPRYNARDVAVMRGRMQRCAVVLGSATPSLESYFNTQPREGQPPKYGLVRLPDRADHKQMPRIRVVDLREELLRHKGLFVFSDKLRTGIAQRLDRKEQVLLFLNRRGYATSMTCPKCGYVAQCEQCSVSLVYHRKLNQLKCHYCGHEQAAPERCPNAECRSPQIKYAGVGTEKIESAVAKNFPAARVARMDSDVMVRKDLYREILGDFRTGKVDILIGTQMIARGLHYPNVTLVGIIYADMALHLPDFRAAERTFQLIVQVAGRAGRGDVEGEVVVQTFTPFADAIRHARQHDYPGFYQQEIEYRNEFHYPPFTRAVALLFRGRNEDKVRRHAEAVADKLRAETGKLALIAGPAPAPMARIKGFFRYQILMRTRQIMRLTETVAAVLRTAKLPSDVLVAVDVDPMSLL